MRLSGPFLLSQPKHDLVREHSRNAAPHQHILKLERLAGREHMSCIIAVNLDYVPAWNLPDIPKKTVDGQVLDATPYLLPFASEASPLTDTRENKCDG